MKSFMILLIGCSFGFACGTVSMMWINPKVSEAKETVDDDSETALLQQSLVDNLDSSNEEVRFFALARLGDLGENAHSTIPRIEELYDLAVEEDDEMLAKSALAAISRINRSGLYSK